MKVTFGPLKLEFKTPVEVATEMQTQWGNTLMEAFGKAAGEKVGDHVGAKMAENVPAPSNIENAADHMHKQIEKAARHPFNPWSPFINQMFPEKNNDPKP